MAKSIDYVSPRVPPQVHNDINENTSIKFTDNLGKYLGVPLIMGRCTKHHFEFIVEKVQQRFSSWEARNLSLAGRCILVQSILSGIPAYIMQTTWISQSTCKELGRMSCDFLWGSSDRRKLHLAKWSTVTKPKKKGGLGLREARTANISLLEAGNACSEGQIHQGFHSS